jgi:hypothetical protein
VKKQRGFSKKDENLKRINRKSILFNNHEVKAIKKYCNKYRVENESKFMREAILNRILVKFSDDYPTLWDQPGIKIQPGFRL